MTDKPDDMPDVIYAWKPEILYGEFTASSSPHRPPAVKYIRADRAPQPTCNADLVKAFWKARNRIAMQIGIGLAHQGDTALVEELDTLFAAAKRQSCNANEVDLDIMTERAKDMVASCFESDGFGDVARDVVSETICHLKAFGYLSQRTDQPSSDFKAGFIAGISAEEVHYTDEHPEGTTDQQPSDDWKPIETAPKDGTEIMLCIWHTPEKDGRLGYGNIGFANWYEPVDDREGYWDFWDDEPPTHWQPLPKPPETK